MPKMTMIQALRSAMDVMLERDDNVVIYGQDVGYFGGVFRCTEGLQTKYGRTRVFDAPISEGGIDAEIIDLRSLWPLDLAVIVASVKKTGRCVIVHEATRTSGFGAELTALVQEHCFYHLEAPIERVTGWDTPYPHAQEWAYFPGPARVATAFRRAMEP